MAWNMSAAKRRALVKLQLRDKNGRWIEMGGGVKWYSSRLKKVISGTVVGTQGNSALIRLPKENPTHEPALVRVPAHTLAVIDNKATLPSPGEKKSVLDTPEFEKPTAVGLQPDKAGSFVKPSDTPKDWRITTTPDGRTYIDRPDGAELYFPARSLDIGDEVIAVEGADPTKPFSMGKAWGRKKTEAVNSSGPKMGTVIDIKGDRYALVQLADGVVIDDPKNPGQKTNTVTVGLSNSVIKATDGLKQALGGIFDDEGFSENDGVEEEEVDPSEEAKSDHVGREVPEDDEAPQEDPESEVEIDTAQATREVEPVDGDEEGVEAPDEDPDAAPDVDVEAEEAAKKALEEDLQRRVAEREAAKAALGDQYDENGLTDEEAKAIVAYERMANRAADKFEDDKAAKFFGEAEKIRQRGQDRLKNSSEDSAPAESDEKAPESAPELEKAPEATPEADKPVEDKPAVQGDLTPEILAGLPDGTVLRRDTDLGLLSEDVVDGKNVILGTNVVKKDGKWGTQATDMDAAPSGRWKEQPSVHLDDVPTELLSDRHVNSVPESMTVDLKPFDGNVDDLSPGDFIELKNGKRGPFRRTADGKPAITTDNYNGSRPLTFKPENVAKFRKVGSGGPSEKPTNAPDAEEAPKAMSRAQQEFEATRAEINSIRYPEDENASVDLDDPRLKAAESADQNAVDSEADGVEPNTDDWYGIWNSTYSAALNDISAEDAEKQRLRTEDAASDEMVIPGEGKPTLFSATVRGNTRSELEFYDESARESEYDQGYRMVGGKFEAYDIDRAISSLEDNVAAWQQYMEAFPTRENPNAGGYTGGHTKAKVTAVLKGFDALTEKLKADKANRDSLDEPISIGGKGSSSEHKAQMDELSEGDKITFTGSDNEAKRYAKNSNGLFDEIDANGGVVDSNLSSADLAWQHRMDTKSSEGAGGFLNGYDIQKDQELGKVVPNSQEQDYVVQRASIALLDAMPIGSTITDMDPELRTAGMPVVKLAQNRWAMERSLREYREYNDLDLYDDSEQGIRLPGHELNDFSPEEIATIIKRLDSKKAGDEAYAEMYKQRADEQEAAKDPVEEVPAEAPPLVEGEQDELPLPGVKKQLKRDDKSADHVKTMDGLEEGDRVRHTNAHDETKVYQKHADGTWDELDPEELDDESPIREAIPASEIANKHKRGDLSVETSTDREEAERAATRAANENQKKYVPIPTKPIDKSEAPSRTRAEEEAIEANSADKPWSAEEIASSMREWFDFAQAVKNGDTRAVETMANNKRTGDEETDIIVNDKGQPFDITLTYNDDGDPVVRLSNFDDSKDIYGDFDIDSSVTPKQLSALIHESINAEDPSAAVAERNGSNNPVDDTPDINERGLTEEEEEQYEQHRIDADVEARAGDSDGVKEYRDKAEAILKMGQDRLNPAPTAEEIEDARNTQKDIDERALAEAEGMPELSSEATPAYEVYIEDGPGRVPAYKASMEAIRESGVESINIPLSDARKNDYTPDEIEYSFDKEEKGGPMSMLFNRLGEFRRWKDNEAPTDPVALPEDSTEAPSSVSQGNSYDNLNPTQDEQAKLDEFDRQMDAAVEADDIEAYDKASDAKYDAMEAIRNGVDSTENSDSVSDMESVEESSEHPLDALGVERRTPEAVEGEDYAPTQQQQDVIDAVLGGLDTKVQAMAGTGKTSTLVALSRRIGEKDGQAIYIAFNKTVQEEAEKRMKGLPVEAKTGHGVAHAWATKNMPHLTVRLGGQDPSRPLAFYKNGKPSSYAKKKAWTSAKAVGDALGIQSGDVTEESGTPKSKAHIVLAVKKTVESFALSDKDTILPEHVPDTFEIAEAHLPKIVDLANEYWGDLKREDGNFRVTHDVYRKLWALSRPDLTDGTGGNKKGANILYIDEAQDTPPVLAKVVADQKMQKVIVGDQNQAIYAFAENIDYLSEADGDVELPLNKSWRFGPEVADAGNRFLQMLGSSNRVVGGGGPSAVTYGMENADAVLVRTNAGMVHAILDEAKRDRRVTAPKGTRANLESLVETVEALKEGREIDTPHDDLIGFKNWDQVLNAHHNGDRSVSMIAKLFDVLDKRSLATMKPSEIEDLRVRKMEDAKKAIDQLVIDVPLANTVKLVKEGDRTYLEPVDGNPFPKDEKTGKQKPWGPNEKKWAVSNFSASLGQVRKPYLQDRSLSFGDQMMKYRKEGGIETVGWTYERGRYYTEDENVVKKFATYSGDADVTISTAHKSKGLEWDRVRIGDDFIGPYEDTKTGAMIWPEDDEYKLGYVALTRAAKELDPGSLSYVFEHTSPNGGTPGTKKEEAQPEPTPEVPEDTAPEPAQIAEEPQIDSTPDSVDVLDEAAKTAPAPVEETEDGEPVEAPFYDDITGLTVDEEAHKNSLLAQAKEARLRKDYTTHGQLVKEVNKMFDIGRERWKAARDAEKQSVAPTPAPTPEPDVAPEPEVKAPAPVRIPAPSFDDEGLTPEERARAAKLDKWINDVYRGYGQGNVRKMEDELFDLLQRGDQRLSGNPEAKKPIEITPEFETPDAVAVVETSAPAAAPRGRKRGGSTVSDANGDLVEVGDTIAHKKHGRVVVTGKLLGAGRVSFIDPTTGKEASVKASNVSLVKDEAPVEAPLGILSGTPGERLMDPNSGKKAFIGGDGVMIVTGDRVRDTKTGQVGTVQTVYTGADKMASVPVIFDGESKPRRVRGTILVHEDSNGGSSAPETAPMLPEAPEAAPEAPKPPEAAPEAPEAPEAAPVVDEKTERRRSALGGAAVGSEVRSKDGEEIYTKVSDNVWEDINSTDSLSDDDILGRILNGEGAGKGYNIRTPRSEPTPELTPEPTPEPEPVPGPSAPVSGQALADTITYESTLSMTDGDLALLMSRYADDPVVFDKIMEVMDERDANLFLPVDTSITNATLPFLEEESPAPIPLDPSPVTNPVERKERNLTQIQKASEEYQNYVMSQYSRAMDDLNGVLLNAAGKEHARGLGGSDLEINIFSGSAVTARKYASEELLRWWEEQGRETLGSFRYRMYGWDNDRKAAQTVRNLGYERGQAFRDRSNF